MDWKCMVCDKIATDGHVGCESHQKWKAHLRQRPLPRVTVGPTVAAAPIAAVHGAAVPAPAAAVHVADCGAAAAAQAAPPPAPPPTPPPPSASAVLGVNEWLKLSQLTAELSNRIEIVAHQLELLTDRVDLLSAHLESSSSDWWQQKSHWDSK